MSLNAIRWFALILAVAAIWPGTSAAAERVQAITIGDPLEPPSLDPTAGAAAAVDEIVYGNIFEGLTRIDQSGAVVPGLARSWEVSPDGLRYVFHLRPHVRFHDGTPMTAADVKFSLDRARAPGSANAQKKLIDAIVAVDIIDPLTVRIELSRPYGALLSVLGWGDMVIVSARSAATNASRPIGTGPFRFVAWARGSAIRLTRFAGYWGPKPALFRATFRFFDDSSAAYAALRSGDVDAFVNYPAPENVAEFRADPRFVVTLGASTSKVILAMNNAIAPFDDLRVRRAVSYALDRNAIIRAAMFGLATPIGSHFSPADPAYIDLTQRYRHDPSRARALLAAAGYPRGFDVTLRLPPRPYARRSGEIIAAELGAIGIRTHIENMEWSQWLDQVFGRHDFALTIVDHVEPMDYDIYARDDYYFGYNSPAYQALYSRLNGTRDPGARQAILGAMQRLITHDAVNAFLFQSPRITIRRTGVTGLWTDSPIPGTPLAGVSVTAAASVSAPTREGRHVLVPLLGGAAFLLVAAAIGWLGPRRAVRRLAVLAATMLAGTIVVFVLLQVVPGDPARYMMGLSASADAVAALHRDMGLAADPLTRYLDWIGGMLGGHFGTSYTYHVDVGPLIAQRLAVSLPLALGATVLSLVIAVPLGLIAAARHRGGADTLVTAAAQAGIALPNFWLAMLLVLVFSIGLGWFPAGGFPGWQAPGRALAALTLPAIALALPQAAILTRVLRAALIETLREDYILTARAKGLRRGQVLWRHAFRNALVPLLSVLGLQIPYLLAGAIIIENVFALPGLGRLVFQAITQRDLIVVQGVVVVLVFAAVLAALVIDILYAVVDPRIARDAR